MSRENKYILTNDFPVKNWGYLENWKSTAPFSGL